MVCAHAHVLLIISVMIQRYEIFIEISWEIHKSWGQKVKLSLLRGNVHTSQWSAVLDSYLGLLTSVACACTPWDAMVMAQGTGFWHSGGRPGLSFHS